MQPIAKTEEIATLGPKVGKDRPRILAADDQQHVLEAIELLLRPQGYEVETAKSPALVREALASNSYDSVLIDLNYTRDTTSGREGLDLLSEIVALDSTTPVIVMTAWANIDLAVEAMRRGARDFIQKPWENERLLTILRTQVELYRALREAERLAAQNRLLQTENRPQFIATAPAMQSLLGTITRVGPSDANVLITGEHGTGKEVVAQTLHALSSRASRSMIAVNTGAVPEGLFESELFGHVKGAFTDARSDRIGRFELADGGTIFLDEIGNVPLHQQAKLLRVLEAGEVERVGSSRPRRIDVTSDLRHERRSSSGVRLRAVSRRLAVPAEYSGDPRPSAAGAPGRHCGSRGAFSFAICGALPSAGPGIRDFRFAVAHAILLAGKCSRAGAYA